MLSILHGGSEDWAHSSRHCKDAKPNSMSRIYMKKICKICFNNTKQKHTHKLQHAAAQAQSLPMYWPVGQTAKLPSSILETILSRTNPWKRVIGTLMYNDIADSERVDRAIIKRIILPFSSAIVSLISITQILVFSLAPFHVLHSNSPIVKVFVGSYSCHSITAIRTTPS